MLHFWPSQILNLGDFLPILMWKFKNSFNIFKQLIPWSEGFYRSPLIWVWTVWKIQYGFSTAGYQVERVKHLQWNREGIIGKTFICPSVCPFRLPCCCCSHGSKWPKSRESVVSGTSQTVRFEESTTGGITSGLRRKSPFSLHGLQELFSPYHAQTIFKALTSFSILDKKGNEISSDLREFKKKLNSFENIIENGTFFMIFLKIW